MANQDISLDGWSTHILISDSEFLLPSTTLYPAEDLYPSGAQDLSLISTIVMGTMSLEELIVDSDVQFGQLYSTKFEVQVYGVDTDLSGKYIIVYQEKNGLATNIFSGIVDSCKQNRDGLDKTIVAYDIAYTISQTNIAPWWTSFWTNRQSATLKQCRDSMLDYLSIDYEDVVLPNDNITVHKNVDMTSMTFATMIKMMCELNCAFPHFSRSGILEFIICNTQGDPIELETLYEGQNSTFEEYTTDEITGIAFYDSAGELKRVVGDQTNVYPVSVNVFTYDMTTATIDSVGDVMLDYISDFTYKPADIKMIVGSLAYKLGDKVHTNQGTSYILQNSYSGVQLVEETMKCIGKKTLGEGTFPQSMESNVFILNEKISRVVADVEHFETTFADRLTADESTITQTASQVALKVSKGTVSSEISAEAGQITISSNRLVINSTNFQLAADGTITATDAILSGTLTTSKTYVGDTYETVIDDGAVTFKFNDDVIGYIQSSSDVSQSPSVPSVVTRVSDGGEIILAADSGSEMVQLKVGAFGRDLITLQNAYGGASIDLGEIGSTSDAIIIRGNDYVDLQSSGSGITCDGSDVTLTILGDLYIDSGQGGRIAGWTGVINGVSDGNGNYGDITVTNGIITDWSDWY